MGSGGALVRGIIGHRCCGGENEKWQGALTKEGEGKNIEDREERRNR